MKTETYLTNALHQPEKSEKFWIILGYTLAFIGSLFGLFIGRYLYAHKRVLPNGQVVYAYNASDRRHGRNIFYIASILMWIGLFIRIFSPFS